MKILYISGDPGIPAFGRKGASTHIREMIAAFRQLGHEVVLAAADLSGDRRADEDFPTVALPRPRAKILGFDGRHLLADFLARGTLRRAVREHRPDAIYERLALHFTAGDATARLNKLPRILEVNAFLAEEQSERLRLPGFAARREHGILRRAPAITAISSVMVRKLEALGCPSGAARSFPMAVNPERFVPPSDSGTQRRTTGWPADATIIGYVGSMNSYHKPVWWAELAEKLLREGTNPAHFLAVGGSDSKVERHRTHLQSINATRVSFIGTVPQAEMPGWLMAMDVVVIPGASEQSTPTKIFEAAALRRPLILPATEPIAEIVGPNYPGLFPPGNQAALEARVRAFLANAAPFKAAAETLRTRIREHHTWRHHAEEIVAWFGRLK